MSRIEGCALAFVGVAIAVSSTYAGFSGCLGAMQDVNLGVAWACVGLGLIAVIVGIIVFVKGMARAFSGGKE